MHHMNKEKWVTLFKTIGLDESTMMKWHREFETRYPEGHQSFLQWLQISDEEVLAIRNRAKSA